MELSPSTQLDIDVNMLEAFIRSNMRPIDANENDNAYKNAISHARLPFESIKRLYMQDFHESLLGGKASYLYNLIKVESCDFIHTTVVSGQQSSVKIPTNLVTISTKGKSTEGNTELPHVVREVINSKLAGKSFSIGPESFHTAIEFTDNPEKRYAGLYDKDKLIADNQEYGLFELGLLEDIFEEEEALLIADIKKEKRMVYFQTIAKRIFELFARLSNTRLSLLMYSNKTRIYSKAQVVAALDIFYNLLSKISEANRIHFNKFETQPAPPAKPEYIYPDTIKARFLFMVDCTPSMKDILDTVKKAIKKSIKSIMTDDVLKNCIIGVKQRSNVKFSSSWTEIESFIDKYIYVDAGGNEAWEDIYDGARLSEWNDDNCPIRAIIAVSDEPADNYVYVSSQLSQEEANKFGEKDSRYYHKKAYIKLSDKKDGWGWSDGMAFNNTTTPHVEKKIGKNGKHITCKNFYDLFNNKHIDFFHVFVPSEKGKPDVIEAYLKRIQSDLINNIRHDYIPDTGSFIVSDSNTALGTRTPHQLICKTASLAGTYLQVMFHNALKTAQEKAKLEADSRNAANAAKYNADYQRYLAGKFRVFALKYSRAAFFNADNEEMFRPSWFVRTLVDLMGRWVNYYRWFTGEITPPGDDPKSPWEAVNNMVTRKVNGNYTWFSRSRKDSGVYNADPDLPANASASDRLLSHFTFDPNEAVTNEADRGYTNSFTGIHLNLLDDEHKPEDIGVALSNGLEILVKAFGECFTDKEILKILDITADSVQVKQLWNTSNNPDATTDYGGVDDTSGKNVGELQYAIMLERIIQKIYQELGVKYSSFDVTNRPEINIDFGLRFLTDETIGYNDVAEFRDSYSTNMDRSYTLNEIEYIRFQELLDSNITPAPGGYIVTSGTNPIIGYGSVFIAPKEDIEKIPEEDKKIPLIQYSRNDIVDFKGTDTYVSGDYVRYHDTIYDHDTIYECKPVHIGSWNSNDFENIEVEEFNQDIEYLPGNYVQKDGQLYKCIGVHSGPWNSNDFEKTEDVIMEFSSIDTYSIGQYVSYNGSIYKCIKQHTGAWSSNDFSKDINSIDDFNETGQYSTGTYVSYNNDVYECDPTTYSGKFDLSVFECISNNVLEYDPNSTYREGDYVYTEDGVYRCKLGRYKGIWDSNYFTEIASTVLFDESSTYDPGQYVSYEGEAYICKNPHHGPMDTNNFSIVDTFNPDTTYNNGYEVALSIESGEHTIYKCNSDIFMGDWNPENFDYISEFDENSIYKNSDEVVHIEKQEESIVRNVYRCHVTTHIGAWNGNNFTRIYEFSPNTDYAVNSKVVYTTETSRDVYICNVNHHGEWDAGDFLKAEEFDRNSVYKSGDKIAYTAPGSPTYIYNCVNDHVGEWDAGGFLKVEEFDSSKRYNIGDVVIYSSKVYVLNKKHKGSWDETNFVEIRAFDLNKTYNVNDKVIYSSDVYVCINSHTGEWNPKDFRKSSGVDLGLFETREAARRWISDKYKEYRELCPQVTYLSKIQEKIRETPDSEGQELYKVVLKGNNEEIKFLEAVIKAVQNDTEFDFQTKQWSLCPYRNEFQSSTDDVEPAEVNEDQVGFIKLVDYDASAGTCPYAQAFHSDGGGIDDISTHNNAVTYGCKVQSQFDDSIDENPIDYSLIPPTCPVRYLLDDNTKKIHPPVDLDSTNSQNYLHTLFKITEDKYVYDIDNDNDNDNDVGFFKQEKDSQGYDSGHLSVPDENGTITHYEDSKYKKQLHAPIQLTFLDHIIKLSQILYKINHWIMFNEPYVKVLINDTTEHYYGTKSAGSFEPISCFRFSNFHALNVHIPASKKINAGSDAELKVISKADNSIWLRAVNRDLSGESLSDTLDRDRLITSGTPEYKHCYPYYNYTGTEIQTGIITSSSTSTNNSPPFYVIHRLNEDSSPTSLSTFQVYVKRFRPIYLPQPSDLYKTDEKDASVYGWNIVPHKNFADAHFNKNNIIIPMNMMSHNSPRCRWFNEIDWHFHELETGAAKVAIKGYYDPKTDQFDKNAKTPELENIGYYNYRDWLMVASYLKHRTVGSTNAAIKMHPKPKDLNNTAVGTSRNAYISGSESDLVETGGVTITNENLKEFDEATVSNTTENGNNVNFAATWLYITMPAVSDTGTHTTRAVDLFPWVWWHSARGADGSPALYCYGLGGINVGEHSEIGTVDKQMRWHAVKSILAQKDLLDPETQYKGAFDPESCGTNNKWHLHGSDYYGVLNNASEGVKNYDRYWNVWATTGGQGFKTNGMDDLLTKPFNKSEGEETIKTSTDYPMCWSLWNVVRYGVWYNYKVKDLDKTEDSVDRTMMKDAITNEEIEEKVLENMRILYKEWYDRFTYNGKYAKSGVVLNNDKWPCRGEYLYDRDGKELTECPKTWIQAQTLCNNTSITRTGEPCYHEWTNVLVTISILYNEVSCTHNSCLTFYTGANCPTNAQDTSGSNDLTNEFKGWSDPGVYKGCGPTNGPDIDNKNKLFRYALSNVAMCRNHLAYIYGGYNSTIPTAAFFNRNGNTPFYLGRNSFPKKLYLTTRIKYINNHGGVTVKENISDDNEQFGNQNVYLKDIYPTTEENDTEGCDMNEYIHRMFPVYPNWYSLRDDDNKPIAPDSVTKAQFKSIRFFIVPCSYYDYDGSKKKQQPERMMAFRITGFQLGGLADVISGGSVTQYIETLAGNTITIRSDEPGITSPSGRKPWGMAFNDPLNRTDAYLYYPY